MEYDTVEKPYYVALEAVDPPSSSFLPCFFLLARDLNAYAPSYLIARTSLNFSQVSQIS